MKKILFVALVILAAGSLWAAEPSLVGKYRCTGRNPDGGNYMGDVSIEKTGETYRMEWEIDGTTHEGVGIFENGVLSVSWRMVESGSGGVVVYKPGREGTLLGHWVSAGGEKISDEILIPVKNKSNQR